MTTFIDLADMQRLVRTLGAERMMEELAEYIREDYLRWPSFQKSARTAHHSPDGVIELMPVADEALYSFKYVNGHPKNPQRQMMTVMAFGVLSEVITGYPLLLSELTLTTALRTAATSALAARVLARPDSRTMALIGNGAQAEFQALAFMSQLGIRELRVYDADTAATAKLMRNLHPYAQSGQLRIRPCESIAEAVRGADIVTTVTADKTRATIVTADMVEPGMHLNAVGGDCPGKTELEAAILERAKVVVEYEPQTRIEGELQQMPQDFPVTHLWEVLAGRTSARDHDDQVTLFDSVGFALEDFSALRYVRDLARAHQVGRTIELVPTLDDPKDLYGGAAPKAAVRLAA